MQPKLSIITVNLNNAEGLRKTIESVINHTFTDDQPMNLIMKDLQWKGGKNKK